MWLKQAILTYYSIIELTSISRDINEMNITGENEKIGHLMIVNYPNLTSIKVSDNSLRNIASLKIHDNPELQAIRVNDYSCIDLLRLELSSK